MDALFYAIADTDISKYLRMYLFQGRIHYRFDSPHILDAALFKNKVEATATLDLLRSLPAERPGHYRVLEYHCSPVS
jgi:hypothetical protein